MVLAGRQSPAGFRLPLDLFVEQLGPLLWAVLAPERRRFHAGGRCPQHQAPGWSLMLRHDGYASCQEDCGFFFLQTAALICDELHHAQAKSLTGIDRAEFVRRRASSRFLDVVRSVNHAERGHLTRPRRTVEQSQWIDRALGGNEYYKQLLVHLLHSLQSDDPPEPGSVFPYGRLAARFGADEQTIARDIATVLDLLRKARPTWVEELVDRLVSQRLTRHSLPDELLDLARPTGDDAREEDARHHAMAAHLLETAARRTAAGAAPAWALSDVIAERLGSRLAARVVASQYWQSLVASVAAT